MKRTSLLLATLISCLSLSACSYSKNSNSDISITQDNGTYRANDAATVSTAKISAEEALGIALEYAGVTKDQVSVLENKLDYDDEILVYEIDFIFDNTEYSFKVDAHSGEIIELDRNSNVGH